MSDVLTTDRILEAAEDALRRYGPAKTTVVDVARALEVSHGTIYRHFPSKAALRDAVAERWLHRIAAPLVAIVEADGPAPARLRRWFDTLRSLKRQKVLDDSELFATYHALAEDAEGAVQGHVAELLSHLERIVAAGMAEGAFKPGDPQVVARTVFDATTRFHHPVHAATWTEPDNDARFDRVWALVMEGLAESGGTER